MGKKTFGEFFKEYRLRSAFSNLSLFADALSEKGYLSDFTLFSHWQKGKRIPTRRMILVCVIELFVERGAITTLSQANEFLESAGHGFLTDRERVRLKPLLG